MARSSGRQMGTVKGTTKEDTTSSIGHCRQSAVVDPGLPHSKKLRPLCYEFVKCFRPATSLSNVSALF